MHTLYCHFCETEALFCVPETGSLLCRPCKEAYTYGGRQEGHALSLDSLKPTERIYFWPVLKEGKYLIDPIGLAEKRPVYTSAMHKFVDGKGMFYTYDVDRVVALFRFQGVELVPVDEESCE